MHEVLVNRLGGLSLPRKSVVRLTDRPDLTLDIYRGRNTTIQQLTWATLKIKILLSLDQTFSGGFYFWDFLLLYNFVKKKRKKKKKKKNREVVHFQITSCLRMCSFTREAKTILQSISMLSICCRPALENTRDVGDTQEHGLDTCTVQVCDTQEHGLDTCIIQVSKPCSYVSHTQASICDTL